MKIKQIYENIDKWKKYLNNYKYRNSQVELTEEIFNAFIENDILIAEAGTGTGKTIAYLMSALLFLKENEFNEEGELNHIIISTETKALQNQILYKDLPLAQKILNTNFKVCIALGANNYLCKRRFYQFLRKENHLRDFNIDEFLKWEKETSDGILLNYPDEIPTFFLTEIQRIPTLCLGNECPNFSSSYYFLEKEKWKRSHILIVNHHLLSTNIINNFTILPRFQYAIIDESHSFPSIFRDTNTQFLSLKEMEDFTKKYKFEDIQISLEKFKFSLLEITKNNENLDSKFKIEKSLEIKGFFELINSLNKAKEKLENDLKNTTTLFENLENIEDKERKIELQNDIEFLQNSINILDIFYEGPVYNRVHYIEKTNYDIKLCLAFVEVGNTIYESFLRFMKSVIFTSATLSVGKNFNYFIEKVGLKDYKENIKTIILDSPFDYEKQAIYYIPESLPDPNHKEYLDKSVYEIVNLIELVKGNTLVIFTSRQNLNYIYDKIHKEEVLYSKLKKLGIQIFSQEKHGVQLSLENYLKKENSVLFGLDSFRQGIDLAGDKLRCVIVFKLPFSVPTDPIQTTQSLMEVEKGNNPFLSVFLPEMIIKLKQGIGRLIRTETDEGIIAILDPRVYTKTYGKMILMSLPKAKIIKDFPTLKKYYNHFLVKAI